MTVYLDTAFAVNGSVNYLLLLSAAYLAGAPLRRGRFLLAANQDSDSLCVFEIDTEGALHPRGCCDTPIGACTVLHIL